jgi:hypothetical protein
MAFLAIGWKNKSMKDFKIFDLDGVFRCALIMVVMGRIREVGMHSAFLWTLGSFEGNTLNKISSYHMYLGDFSLDVD